jgi:hypothetical protein
MSRRRFGRPSHCRATYPDCFFDGAVNLEGQLGERVSFLALGESLPSETGESQQKGIRHRERLSQRNVETEP